MRTLVFGFVLLAATAAQAEDRKTTFLCIDNSRLCSTKNYVTNPNEYGWSAEAPECVPKRAKGWGWKQKKAVVCDCLPSCSQGE